MIAGNTDTSAPTAWRTAVFLDPAFGRTRASAYVLAPPPCLSSTALRRALSLSSTSAAQAPLTRRSPAAVFAAAAAAAAGAEWGVEPSQWHPEERDAAAATPTPTGRVFRSARELQEEVARPSPRGAWCKEAAFALAAAAGTPQAQFPQVSYTLRTPRYIMFKKLRQKISEEQQQQQLQQAIAPTQGSNSGPCACKAGAGITEVNPWPCTCYIYSYWPS
ncbi:uncharacterized protein LOC110344497, partial [Heterocephalus glaber]|uniref:Uncharacterized protein LOC110344497 n=1 Tax=Heterocephalus glaber TaxID=10181 RepID=A0AAX6RB52_HETGA